MLELNLANRAAAQTTQSYNSMCNFSGLAIGANENGIFLLGGYTDHGDAIPAMIKSGRLDLGQENKKRFRFVYFGVETDGDLTMKVYGDGELAGEYSVSNPLGGFRNIRVPISRSVNAHYWEWIIENVAGSFFALHSVVAIPVILHPGHR